MNIYVNNINIINNINKNNKNNKKVGNIIVSSSSNNADNANIIINNSLDILLKSIAIKEFLNNINYKKDVLFNLQKLNKIFIKVFIYRIIQ